MQISNLCYAIFGLTTVSPWMVNSGFIAGKEKTLIIDSGSNYLSAKTIFGYARAVRPENKLILINTEPHFDHIGGNCFFKERDIEIYGHNRIKRSNAEFTELKKYYNKTVLNEVRRSNHEEELVFQNTNIANPEIGITGDFTMDLGGITAEIFLTPGHTDMNLSVYVPDEGVLYCGDVIVTDYIPNLEDGHISDWKQWILSIDKILDHSPKILVSGHGEILEGESIKEEALRIKDILKQAIESGGPPC